MIEKDKKRSTPAGRRYCGTQDFDHSRTERLGVLLINLGTPTAPSTKSVRKFLSEFLNDPRVVELPAVAWWIILHAVVLRLRPSASAKAYRQIWREEGSPLLYHSVELLHQLEAQLDLRIPGPCSVALAMRYGEPSVKQALTALQDKGCRRLIVLPLYPQYSGATTGSAIDAAAQALRGFRWVPEVRFINGYYDFPEYIEAIGRSIEAHWSKDGGTERLLFSFHGMPEYTLYSGDPYFCHCHKSARLIAQRLGLPREAWCVAFQSRFGRARWLGPSTADTLAAWGQNGVDTVTVVCPGFSTDCLETLEEVNLRYRKLFLSSGGRRFEYVPALNSTPGHAAMLAQLVAKHASGWPEALANYSSLRTQAEKKESQVRAQTLGASC